MKRKSFTTFAIGIICCLFIAGCGGSSQPAGDSDVKEEASEETSEDNKKSRKSRNDGDDVKPSEESGLPALSADQCIEEIERLYGTEPVHPKNAETLKAMTDCATAAHTIDNAGVLFSEMDGSRKTWLRDAFLDAVTWQGSPLYEDIVTELGDEDGVSVEDAEKLFADAFGDGKYTPSEYDRVEDGYIILTYADGEAVDLTDPVQYFEDDGYILVSGPMFYESNGEGEKFDGCADILFAKNPASRFGATLLYGRLRNVSIRIASVETSSELPASGSRTYSGKNLIDGNPATVWTENVPGTGVGETITLHLEKKQPVYGVQVVIGYTASYEQYTSNGMPTDIEADFGGGAKAEANNLEGYANENYSALDLADMNRFRFGLDEPVVTDTIKITIKGAKKGTQYDDTCMSEILVYGPGDISDSADYAAVYEPVFEEILDVIEYGYNIDREYAYVSSGLVEKINYPGDSDLLEDVGYVLEDLSGDGIPELLIGCDENYGGSLPSSYIYSIFTIKDDKAFPVVQCWTRSSYHYMGNSHFFYLGSGGAMITLMGENHLSNDGTEVVWDDFYFTDEKENGEAGIYHNNSGVFDADESEELTMTEGQFSQIMEDYEERCELLSWTPIGSRR